LLRLRGVGARANPSGGEEVSELDDDAAEAAEFMASGTCRGLLCRICYEIVMTEKDEKEVRLNSVELAMRC